MLATGVALAVLVLSGCTDKQLRGGFLPGYDDGQVTNQTGRIIDLWVGSWAVLVIVGLIVWGVWRSGAPSRTAAARTTRASRSSCATTCRSS